MSIRSNELAIPASIGCESTSEIERTKIASTSPGETPAFEKLLFADRSSCPSEPAPMMSAKSTWSTVPPVKHDAMVGSKAHAAFSARDQRTSCAPQRSEHAYTEKSTQSIVPMTTPHILTSLRVALGVAWATLVASELVAAQQGLGALIQSAGSFFQIDVIYVGIVCIGVVALSMDLALRALTRRMLRWQDRVEAQ